MTGLWVGPAEDPDHIRLGPAVASGAEGVVYRGSIDLASGPIQVAVKMLHPGHTEQLTAWSARWLDQARLLSSVEIPGLVPVRESFVGPLPHSQGAADPTTGSVYLVMDWVEGITLDRWARSTDVTDAEQLLLVLVAVGAALDRLHAGIGGDQVPVVHRDVKPSNIIVRPDGSTVLVDVGSVRGLLHDTRRSGIVGTPGYIAPEVRADGTYSPASDRYSLGAVAFTLLSGVEPPETGDLDTIRQLLEQAPLTTGRNDLIAHVLQMLDPDPTRRPDHLANWVAQLRRSSLAIAPGEMVLPPRAPGAPNELDGTRRDHSKPSRRSRARTALLLSPAIALAGAGAWWIAQPDQEGPARVANEPTTTTVPDAVEPVLEGVTRADLLGVEIEDDCRLNDGPKRLSNGIYGRTTAGIKDRDRHMAVGDLDGDGKQEGAIVYSCEASPNFDDQAVFLYGHDAKLVGRAPLDEISPSLSAPVIRSLRIVDGELIVSAAGFSPQDQDCCPSEFSVSRWTIEDGAPRQVTVDRLVEAVVGPGTFGPLVADMTYEEAAEAGGIVIDVDDDIDGSFGDPAAMRCAGYRFSGHDEVDGSGSEGRIKSIWISSPDYRTAEGIGIGSTRNEVLETYSDLFSIADYLDPGGQGHLALFDALPSGEQTMLYFVFDRYTDQVFKLVTGTSEFVADPEGCSL